MAVKGIEIYMQPAETINEFYLQQERCPVTGRPIYSRPDWLYLSPQFDFSTGLMADAVITTKAIGIADNAGINRYCQILEDIFSRNPGEHRKYIILEDFAGLQKGEPSARKKYIDFLRTHETRLMAFL